MNMAKIEARAAELHESCRMPMEQARELAVSEASPDWYARGQDWGLADALTAGQGGDWTLDDIARAFAAGARAGTSLEGKRTHEIECRCVALEEQADLTAIHLSRMQSALDQKHAEYEDLKRCAANNARNLNLEGERVREHLRLAIDHIAALNGALEDLASLGATVAICGTKYDDAAARLALGPNVEANLPTRARKDRE